MEKWILEKKDDEYQLSRGGASMVGDEFKEGKFGYELYQSKCLIGMLSKHRCRVIRRRNK